MKNRYLITTLMLVLISWAGCKKEYVTTPVIDQTIPISYKTQIEPIWTAGCLGSGCHTADIDPILTVNQSYSNLLGGAFIAPTITNAENVSLYQSLMATNGKKLMPPAGKLTTAELNLIKTWIAQGSKNN